MLLAGEHLTDGEIFFYEEGAFLSRLFSLISLISLWGYALLKIIALIKEIRKEEKIIGYPHIYSPPLQRGVGGICSCR